LPEVRAARVGRPERGVVLGDLSPKVDEMIVGLGELEGDLGE
jgi:hypothetical protein